MSGKAYDVFYSHFPSRGFDTLLGPKSSAEVSERLIIGNVDVGNSSSSAMKCGWGLVHTDDMYKVGKWDESAEPSYTDLTTDAQDTGTDDVPLFTTTNDDGFIIQSVYPFDLVQFVIETAETGSPTYAYEYWNGSAWTAFSTSDYLQEAPDFTSGSGAKAYMHFTIPKKLWTPLGASDTPVTTDGLSAGYYAIKVDGSTAPDTAPIASTVKIATMFDYLESVSDGNAGSGPLSRFGEFKAPFPGDFTTFVATADANNWCRVEYTFGR